MLTVQTSENYGKGMKKIKTCIELELYFGDTITRNRDFQCVCQACYRKIKTQLKAKQEKEVSFHEGRKLAEQQFIRSRSKRSILLTAPPKKQLLYEKSDSNQPRAKSATTIVKITVSSHTNLLLLIYKSNISYLVLQFTSLSTRASEPSS